MSDILKGLTNAEARRAAARKVDFVTKNGTLFGQWSTTRDGHRVYAVYSYRATWPMWLWVDGQWFGHDEKTSRTTSHHRNLTAPAVYTITSREVLCDVLDRGLVAALLDLPAMPRAA